MPIYIALLRGVNVGQNMLKMERLRALCAELDVKNARTYVQSGNIVFGGKGTASSWAEVLEKRLAGETRLPVVVMVRTADEMTAVLKDNPFLKEKHIDLSRLYVTFLKDIPLKDGIAAASAVNAGADRFKAVGREIYLHCPGGYGETKLSIALFEKKLGMKATTRNWNTVNKLCEMAAE